MAVRYPWSQVIQTWPDEMLVDCFEECLLLLAERDSSALQGYKSRLRLEMFRRMKKERN